MATRSHVDQGVNERRLRPIYDCLDNGKNKKALQEADKLLKKQKDFLCAKALKALALIRLGRQDEAVTSLDEVHYENPTDDPTLQAMTICYRELHKPHQIADAYERATKKDPQNEELLSHLFMSHVRNGDYKKQQQTAMALYKLKSKNPYYFWAIMSIVMQANVADEKLAKQMLLPLAERMTEKFVTENRIEAEAEVQLYLMILEQQEKYDKAIEVLEGSLSDKLSPYQDILQKRKAEFLIKLQKWPEANRAYKKLILGNPDQWSYYLEYFKSVCQLVDSNWQPDDNSSNTPEETIDHNFQMAIDFVAALVEEQNGTREGRKLRGPYLAQIHLLHELIKRGDPLADKIGSLVQTLTNFYEQFGSKPSCFLDLSHIMTTLELTENQIIGVTDVIRASIIAENGTDKEKAFPENVKQMYRHLCYSQLCYYFGITESSPEKINLAQEYIDRYRHGLQFGGDLLPTDFQPADNYCLLAAHIFINVWEETGDETYITLVLSLLEQSLKSTPSNFQMKLLLMKIYNIIGAVSATDNLYESVDVKHVQQETLGYLITEPLLSAAFYSLASSVLGSSIRFYTGNYKDTVDYLISCYKFGSFTKIPELVNFRERVNNSLQYALVTVERMILDLLLETKSYQDTEKTLLSMEIDPEKDHRPTEDLTDNRDIFIYRMYTHKEKQIVNQHIKQSFQEKVWWLKIRNLTVRILAAALYLIKPPHESNALENNITNGEKKNMTDILNDLIATLKDNVASIDKDNMISCVFPVQGPGPSRIFKYLQDGHLSTLIAFAKLALSLHNLAENSIIDTSESKSDIEIINDIRNQFQTSLKRIQEVDIINFSPTKTKSFLEDVTNTIETLSLGTILISICHTILKPIKNSIMRKGKKKKEAVPNVTQETFQEFTNLINDMESIGNSLDDLLSEFDTSLLTSSFNLLSLSQNCDYFQCDKEILTMLNAKIDNSYHYSIKELKELIHSKVKYLQSLKW